MSSAEHTGSQPLSPMCSYPDLATDDHGVGSPQFNVLGMNFQRLRKFLKGRFPRILPAASIVASPCLFTGREVIVAVIKRGWPWGLPSNRSVPVANQWGFLLTQGTNGASLRLACLYLCMYDVARCMA